MISLVLKVNSSIAPCASNWRCNACKKVKVEHWEFLCKKIKEISEKKSTQATSVSMIILAINVVVSTLFIKIRDGGETLTYNIWWSIAETKFFSHTVHRILREFHRVALNILLHYPLWRLQYWHYFCDFYDGLFELEGVGVLKKGTIPMMLHMALMSSVSSYRRADARSEESMLFVFLFPLSHEIENPDVKHILWRKMNCNLIKCFQKNYEHQFL